jgi:hypothetical protein
VRLSTCINLWKVPTQSFFLLRAAIFHTITLLSHIIFRNGNGAHYSKYILSNLTHRYLDFQNIWGWYSRRMPI